MMSNLSRINQLKLFAQEDPTDPFNFYALALEYQLTDKNHAKIYFELLLDKFPDYLPTYYHAAAFFTESGDLNKAGETYEKGITLAHSSNDLHSKKELENAYLNFKIEYED